MSDLGQHPFLLCHRIKWNTPSSLFRRHARHAEAHHVVHSFSSSPAPPWSLNAQGLYSPINSPVTAREVILRQPPTKRGRRERRSVCNAEYTTNKQKTSREKGHGFLSVYAGSFNGF
jgi:hypothetical protein